MANKAVYVKKKYWKESVVLKRGAFDVMTDYINQLMQERRNSIANTLELRLSCTNPSI